MRAAQFDFLMDTSTGALAAVALVCSFAARLFVVWKERDLTRGELHDKGSKSWVQILSGAGIIGAFLSPLIAPGLAMPGRPLTLVASGSTAILAGAALYVWAARTLGAFFRIEVQLLDDQRLITQGPYQILRHPAYLAGVLTFVGYGLLIGNWLSLVILTGATLAAYARRISVEELALAERFGDAWLTHKKRTYAIIPLVW